MELKRGVSLKLEVHGMTNMAIGQTIQFDMQIVGNPHDKGDLDPYYTGKYLITQLRHTFSIVPKKEHSIVMTIVKDGYAECLEQNKDAKEPKPRSKGTVYTNVA